MIDAYEGTHVSVGARSDGMIVMTVTDSDGRYLSSMRWSPGFAEWVAGELLGAVIRSRRLAEASKVAPAVKETT